jgi:hypothetical protein
VERSPVTFFLSCCSKLNFQNLKNTRWETAEDLTSMILLLDFDLYSGAGGAI